MRHSLVRLLAGSLHCDVSWFVATPKPEAFMITKLKFHNVLQGVSPIGTRLTDGEKTLYEKWCLENANRWIPLFAKEKAVIVIDDPQLSGTIPLFKKGCPMCKIIYRRYRFKLYPVTLKSKVN